MKKNIGLIAVVLGLVAFSAPVLAGNSGLTNGVTQFSQPNSLDSGLQAKIVEFNDRVVTRLDAIMSTASTVNGGALAAGSISNAQVAAAAGIAVTKLGTGGLIPANSAASLTNIPAAQLTGNAPKAAVTNLLVDVVRSGTCTNLQTVTFSPAFTATPIVVGTWGGGTLVTNVEGSVGALQVTTCTTSTLVFTATVAQTNSINWHAIPPTQ